MTLLRSAEQVLFAASVIQLIPLTHHYLGWEWQDTTPGVAIFFYLAFMIGSTICSVVQDNRDEKAKAIK